MRVPVDDVSFFLFNNDAFTTTFLLFCVGTSSEMETELLCFCFFFKRKDWLLATSLCPS